MRKLRPYLKGLIVVGIVAIVFCIGVTAVYASTKTSLSNGWSIYFKFQNPVLNVNYEDENGEPLIKTITVETNESTYNEILDDAYEQGLIPFDSTDCIGWYIDENLTQALDLDSKYQGEITIYASLIQ